MEEQLKQIDSLNSDGKFLEVISLLDELLSEDPDNPELLYRKVRNLYRLNADETDAKTKEVLLRKAVDIAKAALEKYPDHPELNKWMAIALGRMVDYTSLNEKIANSWKIREHADRSLAVHPNDSVTLHVVGKWCESVATVGWIERKIAAALFSTPPTATYEEAYDFFLRCEKADPQFKENVKALGDICILMGRKPEAKQWYEKALAMPSITDADKRSDVEMSTAVKKL